VASPTIDQERNAALIAWYGTRGRPLPWRLQPHPYRTLVSEIMCQQTQAERVIPFYERFIARFPTIEALAEAPLKDVITLWNGLGYNARAKRLHETAQLIATEGWPDDVAGLERLPGIGPYTARAVAALSFGMHVAAVDTNLRRVLSRWHGDELDGAGLAHAAATALADADAAAWNQAMMDLGATICRPRRPDCAACPVKSWCAGPETYVPPRLQGRFEGSARQLRGAIVRRLVRSPAGFAEVASATGFPADEVESALETLMDEGLVEQHGSTFRLPE
jgi:A/G-specific adenine glycosylase